MNLHNLQSTQARRILLTQRQNKPLNYPLKIAIGQCDRIQLIGIKDIIYIEASSNYSKIFLDNDQFIMTSINLKKLSKFFDPKIFLRIHQSYLINTNYLDSMIYTSKEIELKNGVKIPYSRAKKTLLTDYFKPLKIN